MLSDSRFPADYHTKIRELIEKQLCELREQIADLGANRAAAQPCNEFAWLAANTEGDLDEALRLSKRSLELVGEHGAFRDTLAQVYFAKGDYANALKHQIRAAELLPYNRDVQKHLVLFRKKASEKGIKLEEIDKLEKAVPAPLEPEAPADRQSLRILQTFTSRPCPRSNFRPLTKRRVDLSLADHGAGRPVVLIHGFPMDHSIWSEQVRVAGPALPCHYPRSPRLRP